MPQISHYEVYTLEASGWVLHARFASNDKAKALDEARAVDAHLGRATKVVRESYNPETNQANDQTVFLSGRALDARRRADQARARGHAVSREGLRPNVRIPEGLEAFADGGVEGPAQGPFLGADPREIDQRSVGPGHLRDCRQPDHRHGGHGHDSGRHQSSAERGHFYRRAALSSTLFAVFMVLFLTSGFFLTARLVPMQGVVGRPKVARSARPSGSAAARFAVQTTDRARGALRAGPCGRSGGKGGDRSWLSPPTPQSDPARGRGLARCQADTGHGRGQKG